MNAQKVLPILAAVAVITVGCVSSPGTEVRAEVAQHFSHEGLNPGDPLAGGTLVLYDGDEVVLEAVIGDDGTAVIDPDPGVYDVQVRLDSAEDPLCFWGATEFGVEFPSPSLTIEAGFICAGG